MPPPSLKRQRCGHSPWTMAYDDKEATCRECGMVWVMRYWPGGRRSGWESPEGAAEKKRAMRAHAAAKRNR